MERELQGEGGRAPEAEWLGPSACNLCVFLERGGEEIVCYVVRSSLSLHVLLWVCACELFVCTRPEHGWLG